MNGNSKKIWLKNYKLFCIILSFEWNKIKKNFQIWIGLHERYSGNLTVPKYIIIYDWVVALTRKKLGVYILCRLQVCALLGVSFVASFGVKVVVATTKRFAHFEKDLKLFWKVPVPAPVHLTICLRSLHHRPHPRGAHSENFSLFPAHMIYYAHCANLKRNSFIATTIQNIWKNWTLLAKTDAR